MAWAQSARELSENYTLTGQSELPTTILSTDPIQQNHSNLKGNRLLVGWHKRTDTKQFPVASLSKKWTCSGYRKKKVREVTRASRARPFVVIAKFLAGNLTQPSVYPRQLFAWKHFYESVSRKSFYFVVELSFFFLFYRCRERERKREGSVDDSFEIGILRIDTFAIFLKVYRKTVCVSNFSKMKMKSLKRNDFCSSK